jgi:hypothetical protein
MKQSLQAAVPTSSIGDEQGGETGEVHRSMLAIESMVKVNDVDRMTMSVTNLHIRSKIVVVAGGQ